MADEAITTDTQTPTETATDATATATTADVAGVGDEGGDQSLMGGATTTDTDAGAGDAAATGEETAGDTGADEVPEAYTFDLPEGVEVDTLLAEEATPILKELGLKQDQVAKLTPLIGKVQERIAAQQSDAHAAMAADWAKTIKADAEIGGANFKASSVNVARALDHFGAPAGSDFRQLLDDTKLGNHPEMFRMFAKIGAALGEDNDFVRGGATSSTKPPREEVLYPNDTPKK